MARYNYIFSHDKPSGKPYRGGIYVPETGETYGSISEASRALGVDSSNISKVLRGTRKTAGGYHFEKTDAKPDPRQKLRKQIREEVRKANKIIKDAREQGRENFVDEVTELDDFGADMLGQTGDNLIDENSTVIDDMDEEELQQLLDKLREHVQKAQEGIKHADERLQEYADLFGVSTNEMAQYEQMIPEINRTIDRAKGNGEGSDVFYKLQELIQQGVSPEALQSLLDKINAYFDNPPRGGRLVDVLDEWEYQQYGGASWEDTKDNNIW